MFDRTLLPPPESFYRQVFGEFRRRPSRGRIQVRCIFHEDKTPSLSLNLRDGSFHCFGCSERGGDIVDFVQLRDGVSFKSAAQQIGAWRDEIEPETAKTDRIRAAQEKERQQRVAEEIEAEVRQMRIAARSYLHELDRVERSVSGQMRSASGQELENLWDLLELICEDRQTVTAEYWILAFANKEARHRFALNKGSRAAAIDSFLTPGPALRSGVRDDDGGFMECGLE